MPGLIPGFALPGLGRNQSPFFPRKIDPRRIAKTEPACHFGDTVDPDPASDFIKINVTGLGNRADHIDLPVPTPAPAMEFSIAQFREPLTEHLARRRNHTPLQGRQGNQHLETRPGRIAPGDRLVGQRGGRVVDQRIPVFNIQAAVKIIGIETGVRNHGQHIARMNIQDHRRCTGFLGQAFGDSKLQARVDGHADLGPGQTFASVQLADNPAIGIDLDLGRPA